MLDFTGLVLANWIIHGSQERIALHYMYSNNSRRNTPKKKKTGPRHARYRRGVENGGTL